MGHAIPTRWTVCASQPNMAVSKCLSGPHLQFWNHGHLPCLSQSIMKAFLAVLIGAAALGIPGAVEAQRQGRDKNPDIPASARPPAGMCRIWLDDVPPAQQPAPTDCATAVRNRPAKGRVIFGDDYVTPKRDTAKGGPPIKGFAPSKTPAKKGRKGDSPFRTQ